MTWKRQPCIARMQQAEPTKLDAAITEHLKVRAYAK